MRWNSRILLGTTLLQAFSSSCARTVDPSRNSVTPSAADTTGWPVYRSEQHPVSLRIPQAMLEMPGAGFHWAGDRYLWYQKMPVVGDIDMLVSRSLDPPDIPVPRRSPLEPVLRSSVSVWNEHVNGSNVRFEKFRAGGWHAASAQWVLNSERRLNLMATSTDSAFIAIFFGMARTLVVAPGEVWFTESCRRDVEACRSRIVSAAR